MLETRRKHLKDILLKTKTDAALIDSPSNLYYYTGFTGGEAIFLMPAGDITGYIITDSRYYEQVEKECRDLSLVRLEKGGYAETLHQLMERLLKDGILLPQEEEKEGRKKDLKKQAEICIAIEDTMQISRYLKLCEVCKNVSFQTEGDAIHDCRMIKDEEELQKIAEAEAIGDAAFTHILDRIKPGVTETEIALELEFFMKRKGASRLSFDTIVASGANSPMPHAQVTDKKIEQGEFVTMDFGCVYQGYCSDMTRTVAVGMPTREMREVYQVVLDANLRAMEGITEGKRCSEIDAIARDYIKKCGYGEYFGHGLGHGVGLDIHEEPRFSPKCDVVTRENMVITDEPGIYLPGRFGVRIEDLVVVKKDGFIKLSQSKKELIIL